ncbi:MAG TPA: cytochrome c [Steroidobacteraceae bacterium]|jgi:mono/diheme cytochrome c family protein|nr:cytochrome c [Steroidobacteraceae bacterium]
MRGVILLGLASLISLGAQAADLDGKMLFHQKCEMCHGAAGMGTGLLARRMKPEVAPLEKRDDLSAAYVERAARIGILNMPPITRGDVSDAQLASIARYLSKGKP